MFACIHTWDELQSPAIIPMPHAYMSYGNPDSFHYTGWLVGRLCLKVACNGLLNSIVRRKWKLWCLSGQRSPYKSFSAGPIGLAESSLLAADTDLNFKILLSISVAKYLWKCALSVAAAWSSLLSWLRPRWVVEAPAPDQAVSRQQRITRTEPPAWSKFM